jgi:hypothetical protein
MFPHIENEQRRRIVRNGQSAFGEKQVGEVEGHCSLLLSAGVPAQLRKQALVARP